MVVFGYHLDLLVEYLPQLDRLVCWSAVGLKNDGRLAIGTK